MELKLETSKEPMIVKSIITDIVDTMGPIELSENTEKQIDMEAMAKSAR